MLLHSDSSDNHPPEHSHTLEETSNSNELQLEGIPRRRLLQVRELLCNSALLECRLGLDLQELELNQLMIL